MCPNLGFEKQLKEYERTVSVRPRAYSIRFWPKSSDEPRHKNEPSNLPEIACTLNRTQLKVGHIKGLNVFAKSKRKDVFSGRHLNLESNLLISGLRPHEQAASRVRLYGSEQLEPRIIEPVLLSSSELKRLSILKLGEEPIRRGERSSYKSIRRR